MKKPTLPAYAPKFSLKPFASCVDNIKRYGPAPKGYRWREVGENYRPNDLCATDGYWWKLGSTSRIEETTYPIATPVKVLVKRDSRGRFAPQVAAAKALPDVGEAFRRYHSTYYKRNCECNISTVSLILANPTDNRHVIGGCFNWGSTVQGDQYWRDISQGKRALSPEDLDYLRAAKEFFEKRIAELTPPAPAPTPTVPELQAKISSLEAEVASLRRKIAGAKVTFPE